MANGYPPAVGLDAARTAIAQRFNLKYGLPLTGRDVFIASGCSGALDMAIGVLASEGDEILIPQPGFTIYGVLARSKGIKPIPYPLLPHSSWEIDLAVVEGILQRQRDCKVWIINNPSNPCGSVYSREHLKECILRKKPSIMSADNSYSRSEIFRHYHCR